MKPNILIYDNFIFSRIPNSHSWHRRLPCLLVERDVLPRLSLSTERPVDRSRTLSVGDLEPVSVTMWLHEVLLPKMDYNVTTTPNCFQ